MSSKKNLINNTIFLYILVFSNYFFSFITIPYQTRILGPEYYGKIGFALAIIIYFQLFLDFGFTLSATAKVSKFRNNTQELSKILTAVTYNKLLLSLISGILLYFMVENIPFLNEEKYLYYIFFIYAVFNALLPDFLYRGLEKMKSITIRSVVIKLFFTVMIFIFLEEQSDYLIIPILNFLGVLGALIVVYIHVFRNFKVKLIKVTRLEVIECFKESSYFFYSRIATTVYDATNLVIIGILYPTGNIVGYYTATNNLVKTAKSGFSPIADSLYPYMIKNKDFNLLFKILKLLLPIVIIGCVVVSIYADELCGLLFGKEFEEAGSILRVLLPLVVIALPNFLLGFPTMSPMGLSKYTNLSTIYGAIFQVLGLCLLLSLDNLNVYTICVLTCFTELLVLSFRSIVIYKNRKLLTKILHLEE